MELKLAQAKDDKTTDDRMKKIADMTKKLGETVTKIDDKDKDMVKMKEELNKLSEKMKETEAEAEKKYNDKVGELEKHEKDFEAAFNAKKEAEQRLAYKDNGKHILHNEVKKILGDKYHGLDKDRIAAALPKIPVEDIIKHFKEHGEALEK